MLSIDGSYGEGGGQILRTAISLSAITGKPIEIKNIRAKRYNPGLQHQHLVAIKAVADLFKARVENLAIGADWIRFFPQHDRFEGGEAAFDIGTAGSIPLVLQTVIPAVSLSNNTISIQITGGTDVRMSPTIDYLRYIVIEAFRNIGIKCTIEVLKRGYYPKGGGIIRAEIYPCKSPNPIELVDLRMLEPKITNVSCNLPKHVGERQISSALLKLEKNGISCNSYTSSFEMALSPGSSILIYSRSDFGPYIGGDAIGEKGKPAEKVGEEAAEKFLQVYNSMAPVDPYLADMLAIPLCLAKGRSCYKIGRASEHLKTNLYIINQIVGTKYKIEEKSHNYIVDIDGRALY